MGFLETIPKCILSRVILEVLKKDDSCQKRNDTQRLVKRYFRVTAEKCQKGTENKTIVFEVVEEKELVNKRKIVVLPSPFVQDFIRERNIEKMSNMHDYVSANLHLLITR